ncbi:MAG: molybdopterin-guanine dinucleotide biosynthesis protein B [Candidatus Brocadiales bacterium]|nr:molybdopterin-guanine dinucleotide biosynthesis protein B [Candidatus Brocadiales bacterium]
MIPIISIVGRSESGKTTLIEKLIPELVRRHYKVATVKHDAHSFEIDKKGKDSWRHKNAGASIAIVSSPKRVTIFSDTERDLTLEELREKYINGVDVILAEGYKKSIHPKIEVNRSALGNDLLCTADDNLIAIVSDREHKLGVPVFDAEDIVGLANLIEEKHLHHINRGIKPRNRIIAVNISEKKGMKKKDVGKAYVRENYGIENDAHSGHWHRQISLLAMESIDKMKQKGLNVEPGSFAENITTEGIDLPNLPIGTTLQIGDEVVLEVTQLGKVCHDRCAIYYQAGDCVMPREGIFAKVIKGGWIEKGDEIKVMPATTNTANRKHEKAIK